VVWPVLFVVGCLGAALRAVQTGRRKMDAIGATCALVALVAAVMAFR
jgi:hypothetical protein